MGDFDKSEGLVQLRRAVEKWTPVPEKQWGKLSGIFTLRSISARELVSLPGDKKHDLIFVCRGLLRFFYLSAEGKETNKAFVAENEFAGPLASSVLRLPVYFGIEALEDSDFLAVPFQDFTALYDHHPVFERLGRILAEQLLVRKELRMRGMLEKGARERYQEFVRQNPGLVRRIPQYHLASYLGISEVSLSRLKNDGRRAAQ